jgi:predicted nuclease of predicted toxin-antitoxin system
LRFLVDNQLPSALARWIEARGFEAKHVLDIGLEQPSDVEICRFAESHDYTLISKDEDLLYLALRPRSTLSLIWIRIGNCRKQKLLNAFDAAWPRLIQRKPASASSNCAKSPPCAAPRAVAFCAYGACTSHRPDQLIQSAK